MNSFLNPGDKPAAAGAQSRTSHGREPAPGCGLVLVAEDDAQVRRGLVRFLSSRGHVAIEAADGRSTAALAREWKPDIVLLDLAMPVKNGMEVLKELAPSLPGTGFIIVTGNEEEEIARACLELGAYDYVPKPVDLEALDRSIKTRLRINR